jgi:chromosome segregation ATPase
MVITKLELQQALSARNAELEAARLRIAELEGDKAALQSELRASQAEAEMFARNALNFEQRLNVAEFQAGSLSSIIETLPGFVKPTDEAFGTFARCAKDAIETLRIDVHVRIAELAAANEAITIAKNLQRRCDAIETKPEAPKRDARKVYEFDPAKPGDFKRASQMARENGGSVRRIGQ